MGGMKERKMQVRAVGGSSKHTNNFTGTVFNEPQKVAGIGHGFGTQRPSSRDSRIRHQPLNAKQVASKVAQANGSSLNMTHGGT